MTANKPRMPIRFVRSAMQWLWHPVPLYVACLLLLVGWFFLLDAKNPSFRDLRGKVEEPTPDMLLEAWRIGVARFMEFEGFMVQISLVLLGTLAFMGGMLFSKESRLMEEDEGHNAIYAPVPHPTPQQRLRHRAFKVVMALTCTASLAYVHVSKVALTYGAYVVHLESRFPRSPVQVITEATYFIDSRPLSGVFSMFVLTLFPIVPLFVCIWGFGPLLGVSTSSMHRWSALCSIGVVALILPEAMGVISLLEAVRA